MTSSLRRAAIAALLVPAASALGAGSTFTKIADTSTPVPSGSGTFMNFSSATLTSNGASFLGGGVQSGLYFAADGAGITRAVDTNTPMPGSTGNVANFNGFSQDGDVTVLTALDAGAAHRGVYRATNGVLTQVAGRGDVLPTSDPTKSFTIASILVPSADNGHVAFNAIASSTMGIQAIFGTFGGSVRPIVDTFMTAPGTAYKFGSFAPPQLRGNKIAFYGTYFDPGGHKPGVYLADDAMVTSRVADVNMARPNGGVFSAFSATVGFDGSTVTFVGQTAGVPDGVFASIGGALVTIADRSTAVPGGGGATFDRFGDFTGVDGGSIVFSGTAGAGAINGVYLWRGGGIDEIVGVGDTIDGKTVREVAMGFDRPIYGDRVALSLWFTDNSRAVYVATVPEPSFLLAPLMLAAASALRGRMAVDKPRQPRPR